MQNFKRVEKLAGFLEGCSRDFSVGLTKEKLANNVCANDGRIMPRNERFGPSIASAQQLGRRRCQREWPRDAAFARTVARFASSQSPARSNSGLAFFNQNLSRRCLPTSVECGFDFLSVGITMPTTWRSRVPMQPQTVRFRTPSRGSRRVKIELIEVRGIWSETRFRRRVNGRAPQRIKEATLTEVFDQLRRWLVKRM